MFVLKHSMILTKCLGSVHDLQRLITLMSKGFVWMKP